MHQLVFLEVMARDGGVFVAHELPCAFRWNRLHIVIVHITSARLESMVGSMF
jgi:hypothetical protein